MEAAPEALCAVPHWGSTQVSLNREPGVQRGLRTGAGRAQGRPSPSLEVWEGFLEEGTTLAGTGGGGCQFSRGPSLPSRSSTSPPGSASAPPWAALRASGASPSAASPLLQGWASTPGAWPGQPLGGASAQPGRGRDHLGLSQGHPNRVSPKGRPASPLWPAGLGAASFPSVPAGTCCTADGSGAASLPGHAAPEGRPGSGPAAHCPQTGVQFPQTRPFLG